MFSTPSLDRKLTSGAVSIALHVGVVALLLLVGSLKPVQTLVARVTPVFIPSDLKRPAPMKAAKGGGGARQPLVSKGQPPKASPRAFVLPTTNVRQAALVVPVIGSDLPAVAGLGVADGIGSLMGGPGSGGFGGPGDGGFGPYRGRGGDGDDATGALRIGGSVKPPTALFTPEPEYSEEARKAKLQGRVLLTMVVDASGNTTEIHVIQPLGLGLDQKAIDAVRRWKFKPGTKDGRPVAVQASAEVSFRLL